MQTQQEIALQHEVTKSVEHFISNYDDASRTPCALAVLEMLGGDAHMAVDKVFEMKHTFLDILTFLTDPEISLEFQKVRTAWADDYALYLKRMIWFLDGIDNKLAYAEMAKEQLFLGEVETHRLRMWEEEYSIQSEVV